MKLSDKAKADLKDLMNRTEYIFDDKDIYEDIYDILKVDLDYFHNIKLEFTDDNVSAAFDQTDNLLCINPEENYYFAKRFVLDLWYQENKTQEEIEEFTKYMILMIMLHESTHGEQMAFAKDDYSPYKNINELYKTLIKLSSPWNFVYRFNYNRNGTAFCFERNANLNAFREMTYIVPEKLASYMKLNYLFNYLLNYYTKWNKQMSPIKRTMQLSLFKYKIEDEGIPVFEKIMHGFTLSKEEYQEYIDFISEKDFVDSTYDSLQEKLRNKAL